MSDTIDAYAAALLAVVRAEDETGADDEILRFAQALEANDELRNTLADPHVPAATRQQIVEDLLQGKASDVTTAAVSLVVGAASGRRRGGALSRSGRTTRGALPDEEVLPRASESVGRVASARTARVQVVRVDVSQDVGV